MKIPFVSQKTDMKNLSVFHHHSGHVFLCPSLDGSLQHLSNHFLLTKLHLAGTLIDQEELGFCFNEIGIHSLLTGAAMAMQLAGIPVSTRALVQ
jgi:hypothetical protein